MNNFLLKRRQNNGRVEMFLDDDDGLLHVQHDFLKGMAVILHSVLINRLHWAPMMESKILIGVGIYEIGKRVLCTSGRIFITRWALSQSGGVLLSTFLYSTW